MVVGSMKKFVRKICILMRNILSPFVADKVSHDLIIDMSGQEVQDKVREFLESDRPIMIARFGATELTAMEGYRCNMSIRNIKRYLNKEIDHIGYANYIANNMWILSGFFPSNPTTLDKFSRMMIDMLPMVDVLGSWRPEEQWFDKELCNAIKVPLADLEPYYYDEPWTTALEGKKVLVIHPFEDSIRAQHKRYDKLFENKKLTPKYELLTIKAVQSIAGNKPEQFDDWFEALDWMKREIDKLDFDIAIIGCGAYGFPLAAYVKQIGKKAIHLGGAVQILFGIRSNAADGNIRVKPLMNEYWVSPSAEETPKGKELVENSRYW